MRSIGASATSFSPHRCRRSPPAPYPAVVLRGHGLVPSAQRAPLVSHLPSVSALASPTLRVTLRHIAYETAHQTLSPKTEIIPRNLGIRVCRHRPGSLSPSCRESFFEPPPGSVSVHVIPAPHRYPAVLNSSPCGIRHHRCLDCVGEDVVLPLRTRIDWGGACLYPLAPSHKWSSRGVCEIPNSRPTTRLRRP